MNVKTRGWLIGSFILLLLLIDQVIKFYIKLTMTLGENHSLFGEWGRILFIENNGMAFGMQFGGNLGKILLTLFRLVLISVLTYYLVKGVKRKSTPVGVLIGGAMILVGAIGNEIDSIFYGVIFSDSTYTSVAELFPAGGGYSGLLMGRVVDMFYFPIIRSTWPDWIPFVGGNELVFFRPIFNFADACITCGVIYMLLFQRSFFKEWSKNNKKEGVA